MAVQPYACVFEAPFKSFTQERTWSSIFIRRLQQHNQREAWGRVCEEQEVQLIEGNLNRTVLRAQWGDEINKAPLSVYAANLIAAQIEGGGHSAAVIVRLTLTDRQNGRESCRARLAHTHSHSLTLLYSKLALALNDEGEQAERERASQSDGGLLLTYGCARWLLTLQRSKWANGRVIY